MLSHSRSIWISRHLRSKPPQWPTATQTRCLLTLAIESSCDDTSVAILDQTPHTHALHLVYHEKVTANNLEYQGVHPLVAQHSHEQNLARLISAAIKHLPHVAPPSSDSTTTLGANSGLALHTDQTPGLQTLVRKPDFISVTRGPGMRSSVNVGLNTAKGLSAAWQVPLVGVNHMQAHALTPRLVSAMQLGALDAPSSLTTHQYTPQFPFLSLLVSGGHTMLLRSESLCVHPTLANTIDIAVGDAIDKMARYILPPELLATSKNTMYGPLLETFAFPDGAADYAYEAPATRTEEREARQTSWGWTITAPFAKTNVPMPTTDEVMPFSFTGIGSTVERLVSSAHKSGGVMELDERRDLAREGMRLVFEHLASRVVTSLQSIASDQELDRIADQVNTLVVSGGVAANGFLRHVLRAFLDARGFERVQLVFPPLHLCTDNAAMIGWAGIEMFEAGWVSDLGCLSLKKWSLDPSAEDGGILGVTGWKNRYA